MKKISILIVISFLTFSCSSLKPIAKKELEEYKNAKKFNKNDFKIYVFNMCEKYSKDVKNTERFCECPDDFYDVAKQDQIKKIEELYLLMHRKTDLVLYFTTKSHKYIYEDLKGFLNDPNIYKDNIALEQIEGIYIGRYDINNHLIHFPSYKDRNDIILHFDENEYPKQILFKKANVATAENDYDISEPIILDSVFKEKLTYKLKNDFSIKYYKKQITKVVDKMFITSKKGKVNISFGFNDFDGFYKLNSKKIKYYPNYSLIQTH